MMRARRPNAGFTLTELLVASLLITVVMTSVYTLFYSAIQTWRTTQDGFNAQHDAMNAMTIIEREVNNYAARADYLMQGTRDEVTLFVVAEPMNVEESEGRHLMRVRYRHNRSRHELIREESIAESPLPRYPGGDREVDWKNPKFTDEEDFVIARNVSDFSIRYIWTPLDTNRNIKLPPPPVEWRYEEKHKETYFLPQALEVTIEFEDPDTRGATESITQVFPFRAPNTLHNKKSIETLLKRG